MATTRSLIAEYAQPIADSVGLTASEYDQTAEGLAELLGDTARRLSPMDHTRGDLEDAAADLGAIARLGGRGSKTRKLFDRIDAALYEAKSELELV